MPTFSGYFKMAASKLSQGYKCEFIDCVPDYLCCKKCTLVARKLSIISCCGESFCQSCIAYTRKEGKPCPACREKNFATFEHIKNQKQIASLQVYCSMKERVCDWSGTLEQLDTHLDPDQDNCQYVDTKCPLNCHMTIPKNKVEQHVAQHCAKRPYVCQHCNFKATYEEVVDTHLLECKYVPLQCPNLCGVTFERDFMEDHMKMCRLQEVGCEFSGVGCDGRFVREDQEEHTRQNSQKHLTLTASLAVETKEHLQQKLPEQDKKHKEEEEKLKQKIEEQEKKLKDEEKKRQRQEEKLGEQEKKLGEQEKKLGEQEKRLGEQEKRLGEQEKKLGEQEKRLGEQKEKLLGQENERKKEEKNLKQKIEELSTVQQQKLDENKQLLEQQLNSKLQKLEQMLKEVADKSVLNEAKLSKMFSTMNRRFEMINFSHEKARNKTCDWKSPAMYTHVCGYKFCFGVAANGYGLGRGNYLGVTLYTMSGEYDDDLQWPANAKFTIELINQHGGENARHSQTWRWDKPNAKYFIGWFCRIGRESLQHCELKSFLKSDTLYFHVSKVELL